ncbi:MAG: Antitoxin VapB47 [Candidatus Eremiobacteraeota bacterium]|nr:Antitoxin VapB47 [Candidatus Eremiobacteraeota bacterium]
MEAVNIADAKAKLSQLVDMAERGEEIVIARHGRPVAKIVRLVEDVTKRYPNRGFGIDRGLFEVPDDFDDPLPPEIMRHFT